MARNRRDPRREKLLDMRRMDEGRLGHIFRKCHPELDWRNFCIRDLGLHGWRQAYREVNRLEDEWIRMATGGRHNRRFGCTAPPAWFRRDLNRKRRAQDRQSMREQLRDGDDVTLIARRPRDVRWLWW